MREFMKALNDTESDRILANLCAACCQPLAFLLRSRSADGPVRGRYIAEYLEGDDQG